MPFNTQTGTMIVASGGVRDDAVTTASKRLGLGACFSFDPSHSTGSSLHHTVNLVDHVTSGRFDRGLPAPVSILIVVFWAGVCKDNRA